MQDNTFNESIELLRTTRFGKLCLANLLSNIGAWAQQVAQPWVLLSLGASSFLVGLDSFAMSAPVWLLTLVGGVLADRGDRRLAIMLFQSIQMLCPVTLAVLLILGAAKPWMIISLSVVVGITDALSLPSLQTIAPLMVEREQVGVALALNSTQFNLSRILGPAFAGVLMASLGAVGCITLNAVSYIPFVLILHLVLPVRLAQPDRMAASENSQLFSGFAETRHQPKLLGALLTVLVTSLFCAPLITFSPVLIKDAFQGSATSFSVSIAAFGAGGLIGAVGLLGVPIERDRRRICTAFAASYAVIMALTAINPWLIGMPALLALAGLSMTVCNTSANTLIQTMASPDTRGQTFSLYMLAMRGGISLGSLLTGASVSIIGVRNALLINALVAVILLLLVGRSWMRSSSLGSVGRI